MRNQQGAAPESMGRTQRARLVEYDCAKGNPLGSIRKNQFAYERLLQAAACHGGVGLPEEVFGIGVSFVSIITDLGAFQWPSGRYERMANY